MSAQFETTEWIWRNGEFIRWENATIHVMSHVVHYGSSVFEGIRCYNTPEGPAIFRLREHMRRLVDSAKIYRMDLPYDERRSAAACRELVLRNGLDECYLRPIALRGYGAAGMNPRRARWNRTSSAGPGAPTSATARWSAASTSASRAGSARRRTRTRCWPRRGQLPELAADQDGGARERLRRGIALSPSGLVSEGSGQNIFLVRDGEADHPGWTARCSRGSPATASSRSRARWGSRCASSRCRGRCSTWRTRSSSPAPPPRSRRCAAWTGS
jgi:branched-chain amino acid aminotransferase